jgi:hypothetical protein
MEDISLEGKYSLEDLVVDEEVVLELNIKGLV